MPGPDQDDQGGIGGNYPGNPDIFDNILLAMMFDLLKEIF